MDLKTKSENVRDFMLEARRAQLESRNSMQGRWGLKEAQRFAIRAAATSFVPVMSPVQVNSEINIGLLERFEEMCRRQRVNLSAGMRPTILTEMLMELWVNQQVLKGNNLSKLVPVTAYCGAIGPQLTAEFPEFLDTPYTYMRAVTGNPVNPRSYLRGVQEAVTSLVADDEFADFREAPFIFTQAAMYHPTDPRGYLRGVQKTIAALAADKEFAEFRDTPFIFKRAAVGSPSNPGGYLRGVQKTIAALAADKEFVEFRDTPGSLKYAAMYHPSDPRNYLRDVQKIASTLAMTEEFATYRARPSVFIRAAMYSPSDPRAWLLRHEVKYEGYESRINQERSTALKREHPAR